jgi:hypothetical protein
MAVMIAGVGLCGSLTALRRSDQASLRSEGRAQDRANRGLVGSAATPVPEPTTIVLDPPLNQLSFELAGDAQAELTAEGAVAVFEGVNPDFQLPDDATAQLGYYTAAVGDGTYRFEDRLAWGFTWHQCVSLRWAPSPPADVPCRVAVSRRQHRGDAGGHLAERRLRG